MKKKIFTSVFVIVVCIAMISAATMAWFTDMDTAGEATFTAGTVSIEAGGSAILSQYFDPDSAEYLYGVEAGTGDLYEIDVQNKSFNRIFDTDMVLKDYSPNGLAFDNKNKRLYFSVINGSRSTLWFYDFKSKTLKDAGNESTIIYGATFGDGYYWYIKNNSDELYKVDLKSDGTKNTSTLAGRITGGSKSFGFGDVVFDIRGGILYGSSSNSGKNREFFSYDIAKQLYQTIETNGSAVGLQIAFGSNGTLYGHNTETRRWYTVSPEDGTVQNFTFGTDMSFNDLASGYVSVWNPGDTDKMKYFVKNTGTKKIRIKAQLTGQWEDSSLNSDVVEISLADGTHWSEADPEDGFFYYNEILNPGESAELCVEVHLNGPETGNEYQGRTYTLSGMMYAIQASNGAAEANGWFVPQD